MTILEKRVENLEQTVTEVLPAMNDRFDAVERRLGHLEDNLERHIVMLGAFLKRRLDPNDEDEWRPG